MIVALGCGDPDVIPLAALRLLAAQGAVDVRAGTAIRDALAENGVTHSEGAAVIAACDEDAYALARSEPERATQPDREALEARVVAAALARLWQTTRRLRRDCPWDRAQSARTIVTHTIEEAYEVADVALREQPGEALMDELGDLLFQTYFLALIADEHGAGGLDDVADRIQHKLVRRHPHIFGSATASTPVEVRHRWEAIKRDQEGRQGVFHDVASTLPSLLLARKLQQRAAAIGIDYADQREAMAALTAELDELQAALAEHPGGAETEPARPVFDEAGAVLFAAVSALRIAGVDPELALRAASRRFQARVEHAATLAAGDGQRFETLTRDRQHQYYRQAKEMITE